MTRGIRAARATAGALVSISVSALAAPFPGPATYNQGWSSTFERNETGEPGDSWCTDATGFHYADGGFSAYHAASTTTFWIFGDTSNYDDPGFQANTIATTKANVNAYNPPAQTGSPASDSRFYARGDYSPVWNLLVDQTQSSNRNAPFVVSSDWNKWYWPGGAVIPSGTNRLFTFWGRVKCPDQYDPNTPRSCHQDCTVNDECYDDLDPNDGIDGDTCVECDQWPHTMFDPTPAGCDGVQKWCRTAPPYGYDMPGKACEVSDVLDPPNPTIWPVPTCSELTYMGSPSPTIDWGAAVLEDGGYFYIYGYRRPQGSALQGTVVLARTSSANSIRNYSAWSVLAKGVLGGPAFWVTGDPPNSASEENGLYVVASQAAPQFTVTKVNFSGVTRYVMVQGVPELFGHDVLVRVSVGANPTRWNDVTLPNATSSGTTCMINMATAGALPNDDPFDTAVTAGAYHQMAHPEVSDTAGHKLKISYYSHVTDYSKETNDNVTPRRWQPGTSCGTNPQDWIEPPPVFVGEPLPGQNHNNVVPYLGGRLRFADIDLTRLRPWCEQSDRSCCRMPSASTKNCNLGAGVCCAACNSAQVGGVRQCGGPDCSSAGTSSQCCAGPIQTANVACNTTVTNTPCVLNKATGSNVLCTQNCFDAALGRQRCGGSNCDDLPGGIDECCGGPITNAGKLCDGDALKAPCLLP